MEFNYYYGAEAEQFSFIRIPKVMLTEEKFSSLSLASKILYGVLLDRMSLSVKNGWLDEEQRVFIIFKIEEIQDLLGFSKKKSIEYLGELEAFGLVEKKRRGLGLPSILYIKSFMTASSENGTSRGVEIDTSVSEKMGNIFDENEAEGVDETCFSEEKATIDTLKSNINRGFSGKTIKLSEKSCVRSVDLGTSGGVEITLQEVSKLEPQEVSDSAPLKNNTNINNTYMSNTKSNLILSAENGIGLDEMRAYADIIKANIEYDCLLERYPYEKDLVHGIYELIMEMVLCKNEYVVIASSSYPVELVKSKFPKLDYSHVEYVLGCFQSNTTKVKNIKKYLLAALFNVFQAKSIAQKHNCNLVRLDFQQEQGLMSSLPLAQNLIEIHRGMTTSSTAIFVPFTTQELFQSGDESLYYIRHLTQNMKPRKVKKSPNPNRERE